MVVFIRQLDENKEKLLTMALRQQSQTNEDGQPKSPDNGIDDAMVFKVTRMTSSN